MECSVDNASLERFVAFDSETFYDSKNKYSLRNMSMWEYVNHPLFDNFLVSFFGEDKDGNHFEYVGAPEDFDWAKVEGVTFVCHNAAFDGLVLKRIREIGLITCGGHEFVDTADLAAFLRAPRNLKGASKYLLGIEVSKAVRDSMDGKKFRELLQEERQAWLAYAGKDAEMTYKLWEKYGSSWPQIERMISKYNREAGWHGVAVDQAALSAGIQKLFTTLREAEAAMPWVAEGKKAGSAPSLRAHARKAGLDDVPASLNKQNPEMVEWIEKHKDQYAFIQARMDHASAITHYARLVSMNQLAKADDVIRFDILYHGAGTGRVTAGSERKSGVESTSDRFNPLNLPKKPVFDVDIRGMLVPRAGHKFVIFDYSQIEARIVQWLAGATTFIDLINREGNIYQAAAKQLGWFPMDGTGLKSLDPDCYALSKACLTAETLVLTEAGFKRVVDVTVKERVWDGRAWVRHEGVVCHGLRSDCVTVNGERFTGDHRIYRTETETTTAQSVSAGGGASEMAWRQAAGPGTCGDGFWALAYAVLHSLAEELWTLYRLRVPRLWRKNKPLLVQSQVRALDAVSPLRVPGSTENVGTATMGART